MTVLRLSMPGAPAVSCPPILCHTLVQQLRTLQDSPTQLFQDQRRAVVSAM